MRLARAVASRRVHRWDSLFNIEQCARFGLRVNPIVRMLAACAAALDISGGDSFTDLYGASRFDAGVRRKLLANRVGIPLILLPQTYGPFRAERSRRIARRIVRAAAACWARDARSFEVLKDLLGDAFDPDRHKQGVDVAFGLRAMRPAGMGEEAAAAWPGGEGPLLGFNVSGLIWNSADGGRGQFGFRADYRAAVVGFLRRALEGSDCRILLVPHVVTEPGHYESDIQACREAAAAVGDGLAGRVMVAPTPEGPCEAKWMISRCDWFCGTRMHATIAGLSSGVPTAAIAYSDKTLGVFETCGQGSHVHDPRTLGTDELVERVLGSWSSRAAARASLAERLPDVLAQAERQMDEIAGLCLEGRAVDRAAAG